ncbi:DUF1302 domain-containing protein [Nevskia ramosa]|uniref:DUF1302 domain-containing protein n=1 Tax=Nevskia ramosa TaxID=64002 RepID=UPI0003B35E11|nr:DUF1302 family protein [Nevskia ramosa]
MKHKLMGGVALAVLAFHAPSRAIDFEYGELTGAWKSTLSVGSAFRTEKADSRLIGKLNVNPSLCPDGCLSFAGDPAPNQRLVDAPGAFIGSNKDDGDLNYRQWNPVAAITKFSTDLNGTYGDYTFKIGAIAFFDPVNFRFNESHPDTTFQPSTTGRPYRLGSPLAQDIQIKDAFIGKSFQLFEHDFNATVGYQHIRWGESTFVVLNSINELQPPDARLLHQPGTPINEVFRSVPLITLNTQLTDGMSLDFIYQLAWRPVNPDPGGAFYSNIDFYKRSEFLIGLGQFHEDPNRLQRIPFPINAISNSSFTANVLPLKFAQPNNQGQVGAKLTWYLPDFNGGTELGFYGLNYHSRLPYFSVIATNESCARNAAGFVEAFTACKGFVGLNPQTGLEPAPIDSEQVFFAYPENIQVFGMSFNTNVGKWSLAGEYSIRPNMPLQVSASDVFFAGLQPSLPRQDITLGLSQDFIQQTIASLRGSIGDIGSSNPQELLGQLAALLNGLPVLVPAFAQNVTLPASRSAVPDFLSRYRGIEIQPNQRINGYERFVVDQLDITGIRAIGASENPFGADQVIILTELGMTHIYGMPNRSRLQLEGGDNNGTHASPGADGTGQVNGQPDTRSLNPTQQTSGFASSFSAGYRILTRFEYNNLLAGLNFKPAIYFGHDFYGISPLPVQNFIEGTISYAVSTEIENGGPWSGQLIYQGSTGGGTVNTQRDRDVIALQIGYTF